MIARTRGASRDAATRAADAFRAVGLKVSCGCTSVAMRVDGMRWFARFELNVDEHRRRASAGIGAVTDTGLLHALWALPEGIPIAVDQLDSRDRTTLLTDGHGVISGNGDRWHRTFRPAGRVDAVAAVETPLTGAVMRVGSLPPIYTRVAATSQLRHADREALEVARVAGIGVVALDDDGAAVVLEPTKPCLGVPAVYRWWVSEAAYRNWLYTNCAHWTS